MKFSLTSFFLFFVLCVFGQPGNTPGTTIAGNNILGCDTITGQKVFYDIINSKVCNCLSPNGDLLEERSCANVVPGECPKCEDPDKEICFEVQNQITGNNAETWVIIAGELEVDNVGGNQNGGGPFINTITGNRLEYSTDGVNFAPWDGQFAGASGVINTDPIYIRDGGESVLIDITSFQGGGSTNYTAIAFLGDLRVSCIFKCDGGIFCCDQLGQEIEYDDTWDAIECKQAVSISDTLFTIDPNRVVNKKCYSRQRSFFDNVVVIDSGNRALTDDVIVVPDESGKLCEIETRIDNRHPINTFATDSVQFFLDGAQLPIISNNNSNPPTFPINNTNEAINTYRLNAGCIDVSAGQTYTMTAVLWKNGAVITDNLIGWQTNDGTAGDADGQATFASNPSGIFPAVHWINSENEIFCEEFLADGSVKLYDPLRNEIQSIPSDAEPISCDYFKETKEDCGSFTGDCRCYGDNSNTYEYVNSDNATEGAFSMNSNTIKWETGGGDGSLDGSIPYIDNCLSGGGEATMTITDTDGNIVIFVATGFINPVGTAPATAYSGTGAGSFSGKVDAVTITCSTSQGGKACLWVSCDKTEYKWYDGITELTPDQVDSLYECTVPFEFEQGCEETEIQSIACSLEDTDEVDIDDQILTVAKKDCNDVITSSLQYNLTNNSTLLVNPVNTTDCDPDPTIEETEECFIDEKGQKWTELTIIDGLNVEVIYINEESQEIGTPIGDPKNWKRCLEENEDFEIRTVCILDDTNINGINGYRWDSEGNAATHNAVGQIFTDWKTHINGTPDEISTITDSWNLNDLDFPLTGLSNATDRDISSQELYWAYIYVDQPILLNDNNGNTGESIRFYLQDCNKDMLPISQTETNTNGVNRGLGDFKELCEGYYKIAIQISDYSVYGGFNLRYSTDGGQTYSSFPMSQTFTIPIQTTEVKLHCYADGSVTYSDGRLFDGTIVDCNPVCYPLTRDPLPDVEVTVIPACDDVTGDPADYVSYVIEVVTADNEQTFTNWINYGDDTNQTEYTIQGNPVNCATGEPIEIGPVIPTCDDVEYVQAFAPIGTQGVNVERWNTNFATGTNTGTVPSEVFNGPVDYSGMPSHVNGSPDGTLIIENDLLVLDQANARDQMRGWTYLYLSEPARVRELFNRAESVDYFLGECCADPVKVATGVYPNTVASGAAFDVSLLAGIHYIGFELFDWSAYSGVNYEISYDSGTTWSRIPAGLLYATKPRLQKCTVKACIDSDGNAVYTDAETGELLGGEFTLKEPNLCSPVIPANLQCSLIDLYEVTTTLGGIEQQWTTSAVAIPSATGTSYLTGFTAVDSEGYPAHVNTEDAILNPVISSTTNASGLHQAQLDGWIWLESAMDLREFNPTAEASGIWLSETCGSNSMVEILDATYTNTTANTLGTFQQGFYRVRLYVADFSANGITRLQGLSGSGNWQNLPIYESKPIVKRLKGWACEDGTLLSFDRSEILDPDIYLCYDPNCVNSGNCKINVTD